MCHRYSTFPFFMRKVPSGYFATPDCQMFGAPPKARSMDRDDTHSRPTVVDIEDQFSSPRVAILLFLSPQPPSQAIATTIRRPQKSAKAPKPVIEKVDWRTLDEPEEGASYKVPL